jgi:hypothetical protein
MFLIFINNLVVGYQLALVILLLQRSGVIDIILISSEICFESNILLFTNSILIT